jgi:hypothetical protein
LSLGPRFVSPELSQGLDRKAGDPPVQFSFGWLLPVLADLVKVHDLPQRSVRAERSFARRPLEARFAVSPSYRGRIGVLHADDDTKARSWPGGWLAEMILDPIEPSGDRFHNFIAAAMSPD